MVKVVRMGTFYGGWSIPSYYLSENSICYSFGAGEDISFDVSLVDHYGCPVHIFDPTPRAKIHFDELIEHLKNKEKFPINSSNVYYDLSYEKSSLLHFYEIGLWFVEGEVKFYEPINDAHVSHSILNLQKTERFFIGKVNRLKNIMEILKHDYIDVLKMDIEGAEYKVIDTIIEDGLDIRILCVEYDEANNALDNKYEYRINNSIKKLIDNGYMIIDRKAMHNYTFIRNDIVIEEN